MADSPKKQPDKDDALTYAQLAIFVGELLSQSEPHTNDGNYTFSQNAMDGLAILCSESGMNLWEKLKIKGQDSEG